MSTQVLWPRALLSSGTILDGVKNRGVLAVLAAKVECGVRAAQVLPLRGSSWWGYAMAVFFSTCSPLFPPIFTFSPFVCRFLSFVCGYWMVMMMMERHLPAGAFTMHVRLASFQAASH